MLFRSQMSKTLATIEVNAPIDYHLEDAKLGNLFTPEAHAWMKKLEFKQMQSRFPKQEQEAPVQQYFRKITERTEAEQIFAKAQAAGRVGFQFLFEPERVLQMAETRMGREEAENIPGNTESQERTGLNGQNIPGSTEAQKTNGLDGQDVPGDTESQGMQLAMESDGQLTLEGFLQIQGAGVSAASQMPGAGSFAAVQAQGADSPAVAQAQEGEAGVSAGISPILGLALAFGRDYIYWFSQDGSSFAYGRSMTYRFAQAAYFAVCALCGVEAFPLPVLKGILARHLVYWLNQPIFDNAGILTIGYAYPNLQMSESYNAPGSPYWALKAFCTNLDETEKKYF